jgi:two-component system LytT family sensor kinase
VLARLSRTLNVTLGLADPRVVEDAFPADDHRMVVAGPELRTRPNDATPAVLLRLRTVDRPYPAIACGPMPAGRRLLSDDVRLIEAMLQLAARRLDSLRVALERLSRNQREQAMQQLATEAELRALRAQLHPHFLFNALTTVGYLIQSAPSRAIDTLMRLTTVLRAVLNRSGSEFSTLGDEIDLVRSYLDIERARFEERLRVEIDVPAILTAYTLPTLLLQPLVENAVKHGLAPTRTGGTLRIRASDHFGRLKIVVEDTGLGFDPDARGRTGVGLSSVAQRLATHYGPNASFEIHSEPGHGATIEIVLPAERRMRERVTPARRRTG